MISVASKVAFHLALDGHIGADRPRAPDQRPVPLEPGRAVAAWRHPGAPRRRGPAELVRRWLARVRPGTDDIAWWTGLGRRRDPAGPGDRRRRGGAARRRTGRLRPARRPGDDPGARALGRAPAYPTPRPWAGRTATTWGWHRAALFDSAGNAGRRSGPTAHRRRMGAAAERGDRAPARADRRGDRRHDRRRGRTPGRLARPDTDQVAAVPATATPAAWRRPAGSLADGLARCSVSPWPP